jgi:hypothetical protein
MEFDPLNLSARLAQSERWNEHERQRWDSLCTRLDTEFDVEGIRYIEGSPRSSLIAFKRNAGCAMQMIDAPGPSPTLHALALLVDGPERDRNA